VIQKGAAMTTPPTTPMTGTSSPRLPVRSQPSPLSVPELYRALDDLRRIEARLLHEMDDRGAIAMAYPRPGWPIRRITPA
jgi:hypothetical protein